MMICPRALPLMDSNLPARHSRYAKTPFYGSSAECESRPLTLASRIIPLNTSARILRPVFHDSSNFRSERWSCLSLALVVCLLPMTFRPRKPASSSTFLNIKRLCISNATHASMISFDGIHSSFSPVPPSHVRQLFYQKTLRGHLPARTNARVGINFRNTPNAPGNGTVAKCFPIFLVSLFVPQARNGCAVCLESLRVFATPASNS